MSNLNPLVSVIIPTYNRPEFLKRSLFSVQNQKYKNVEVIVVNDAGEDVSQVVLSSNTGTKMIDHNTNQGLAASRNTGLANATGEYVCFLDDDDMHGFYFLEAIITEIINLDKSKKIVYCDSMRIHEKLNKELNKYYTVYRDVPYSYDFNFDQLLFMNISPVNCFVVKRECFDNVPPFDTNVNVYEDWIMWIELSLKYNFEHLPLPLVMHSWREDGSTMSSTKDFKTPLKDIYKKYYKYAKNPVFVAMQMNAILKSVGQTPLFEVSYDNSKIEEVKNEKQK